MLKTLSLAFCLDAEDSNAPGLQDQVADLCGAVDKILLPVHPAIVATVVRRIDQVVKLRLGVASRVLNSEHDALTLSRFRNSENKEIFRSFLGGGGIRGSTESVEELRGKRHVRAPGASCRNTSDARNTGNPH